MTVKSYWMAMLSTGLGLSALVLAYLAALPLLQRRYGPRGLYRVWLVLLAGLLIPFSLLWPDAPIRLELPTALSQPVTGGTRAAAPQNAAVELPRAAALGDAEAGAPVSVAEATAGTAVNGAPRGPSAPADWLAVCGWIWLAGAAGVLAAAAVRHLRFMRTVRRWQRPCKAEGYGEAMADCLRDMRIRRQVALRVCPMVTSPMLAGFAHPTVFLPDEELTLDELALVLRHELTHYRRGDLAVKGLLLLCYALHWYNPAVWAMGRSLCFYQEASCDSHVTERADEEARRFYSETIIRVIRRQARARTALSTSFYGGRSGIKRRILSIMQGGSRRTGAALCALALALTALGGGALALQQAQLGDVPLKAWVHSGEAGGSVLLEGPTANDLTCPYGIYLNGTPVTIVELCQSSFPTEWACEEGQPNWARVLIGGDGDTTGISGWMPLRDLAFSSADTLPAATVSGGGATGHTSLYTLNTRESEVARIARDGAEVTVLGQLDYWLHVALDGEGMFMLLDMATLSPQAEAQLYDLLPDRFSGVTRAQYDAGRSMSRLIAEKQAQYGGAVLDFWSLEDKAWYSQLEDEYLGSHDHYYILPGEGDLPLQEAQRIALEAYAKALGRESVSEDEVDVYPGFYRMGYTEPRYWSFCLCMKGTHDVIWRVELTGDTGDIIFQSEHAAPPEANG